MEITPIAYIHTPFPTKFGIPKQSGRIPSLSATIVFVEPFAIAEAIRGLEKFSHLWLIWEFSAVPANKPGALCPLSLFHPGLSFPTCG